MYCLLKILEKTGNTEMGRKLPGSDLLPDLCIGDTLATLRLLRKEPQSKHLLIHAVSLYIINFLIHLTAFELTPSMLTALLVFNLSISLDTSSTVTGYSDVRPVEYVCVRIVGNIC